MQISMSISNEFGLAVGSHSGVASIAVGTVDSAIQKLDDLHINIRIRRLCLAVTGRSAKAATAIFAWAEAAGIPVEIADSRKCARTWCRMLKPAGNDIVAEAEARGFGVSGEAEARALAVFNHMLSRPEEIELAA